MADTPLKAGKNAKPIQNPPEMQTSVSCYFFGSCSWTWCCFKFPVKPVPL